MVELLHPAEAITTELMHRLPFAFLGWTREAVDRPEAKRNTHATLLLAAGTVKVEAEGARARRWDDHLSKRVRLRPPSPESLLPSTGATSMR